MPLIKCPMCEREISPNAIACPHCGEPIKKEAVISHPSEYKDITDNDVKLQGKESQRINKETNPNTIRLLYKVIIDRVPTNNKDCVVELLKNEISCTNEEALKYINYVPSVLENDFSYPQAKILKDKLKEYRVSVRIQGIRYGSDCITEDDKYGIYTNSDNGGDIKKIENHKIIVECPNCGSNNTNKISVIGRVTSGLAFGIFSSSIGKTWKCNKCGYKW